QTGEGLKLGIHGLISRLLLMDTDMKLALSGINLKEPVCVAFAVAPPDQPKANAGGAVPALVEDVVPLPPVLLCGAKALSVPSTLLKAYPPGRSPGLSAPAGLRCLML